MQCEVLKPLIHKSSFNVLFLCKSNSAWSIMAEAILNFHGNSHFRAFSAGCHPTGQVNPFALKTLKKWGCPTNGLRSKSLEVFSSPIPPHIDFAITACGNADEETCPLLPGRSVSSHWNFPDPAAFRGTEEETLGVFEDAFMQTKSCIDALIEARLPLENKTALKNELDRINISHYGKK